MIAMPKLEANGIQLYYEVHGDGEPLLLIAGAGYGSWMWFKQIPELSRHFKVITFDNRGTGGSDKPDVEYSIQMLAQDTIGLLDALNLQKAYVLGISLGGFIAQELALSYPQRVAKLILCSTSFGGPNMVLPSSEVLQFMIHGAGGPEENFRRGLELAFSAAYLQKNPKEIEYICAHLQTNPQPRYAYLRQLMAPACFNAEGRLGQIKSPTLVMAGAEDKAVPAENSRRLAAKIKAAKLIIFERAGHLFCIERAQEANKAIIEFLRGGKVDHHELA